MCIEQCYFNVLNLANGCADGILEVFKELHVKTCITD